MKKQYYFYITIACSIVVILLTATEDKIDFMNKMGIALAVTAIIISIISIVLMRNKGKKEI